MNNDHNQRLLDLCRRDLADYAASRKTEVDKGRETPELAGLLVQKYGYGMLKVLELLSRTEETPRLDTKECLDVDAAVATINPDWAEFNKRRWAAEQVGIYCEKPYSKPVKYVYKTSVIVTFAGCILVVALLLFWTAFAKKERQSLASAEKLITQYDKFLAKHESSSPFRDFQGVPFKPFSSSKLNVALSKDREKFPIANGEYRNPFINLTVAFLGGCWLRLENADKKYDLTSKSPFWAWDFYRSLAMVRVKDDAISVYFNSATVSEDTVTFQDTLAFSQDVLEELAKKSKVNQKNTGSWK